MSKVVVVITRRWYTVRDTICVLQKRKYLKCQITPSLCHLPDDSLILKSFQGISSPTMSPFRVPLLESHLSCLLDWLLLRRLWTTRPGSGSFRVLSCRRFRDTVLSRTTRSAGVFPVNRLRDPRSPHRTLVQSQWYQTQKFSTRTTEESLTDFSPFLPPSSEIFENTNRSVL